MQSIIVILEDDPDRCWAFRECLSRRFPMYSLVKFDNAPDTIRWLRDHLDEAVLICLDHDLGPNRQRGEEVVDPGTERDVVDYLATRKPCCPVIIHTTNSLAAPGMAMALEDAGWLYSRVVPYNDIEWVEADWMECVVKALAEN